MALARFRFEYEPGPTYWAPRRWYVYHDAVPIQAEVYSMAEVESLGVKPQTPGYDGLLVLLRLTCDCVVLCPWAPARPHPDVDVELMAKIVLRTSTLIVRYPNGRVWLHVPGNTA